MNCVERQKYGMRHFISAEFWPETAEDTLRIARA